MEKNLNKKYCKTIISFERLLNSQSRFLRFLAKNECDVVTLSFNFIRYIFVYIKYVSHYTIKHKCVHAPRTWNNTMNLGKPPSHPAGIWLRDTCRWPGSLPPANRASCRPVVEPCGSPFASCIQWGWPERRSPTDPGSARGRLLRDAPSGRRDPGTPSPGSRGSSCTARALETREREELAMMLPAAAACFAPRPVQ